jgi:RHS repeat-associated protein
MNYYRDQIGSVRMVTKYDTADDVIKTVWKGDYTPYGEILTEDYGMNWLPLKTFALHEYDRETGLYYAQARWYDPETSQFVSEDGAQDGLNWYGYCGTNPLGGVDPSGMDEIANESNNYCGFGSWGDYSFAMSCAHNYDSHNSAFSQYLSDIYNKYSSQAASFIASAMGYNTTKTQIPAVSVSFNLELDKNITINGKNVNLTSIVSTTGNVYGDDIFKLYGDATIVSDEELIGKGFDPSLLVNAFTGFKSAVYKTSSGIIIYAIAGTNNGSDGDHWFDKETMQDLSAKDMNANYNQVYYSFGWIKELPDQYKEAIDNVKALVNAYGKENIIVAGQSLGGGLASLAGYVNKVNTITFNASGIGKGTLKQLNLTVEGAKQYVTAYYVKGEELSYCQDEKYGWIIPKAIGNRILLDSDRPLPVGKDNLSERVFRHIDFAGIIQGLRNNVKEAK